MAPRTNHRGFTIAELLGVFAFGAMLLAPVVAHSWDYREEPPFAWSRMRERETLSNLQTIRVAVERYATDHGEYPQFLLGGDVAGWTEWHRRYDETSPISDVPQNAWLHDPLIAGGYISSYPTNPFVDSGLAMLKQTGNPTELWGDPGSGDFIHQAGDGDARFGFAGFVMGNGLEDPKYSYFNRGDTHPTIETSRTLRASTGGDPARFGFATPDAIENSGLPFTFGGKRAIKTNADGIGKIPYTAFTHWPGNFFYRGFIAAPNVPTRTDGPGSWKPGPVKAYFMGVYGSYTSEGFDVLRLEDRDPSGQPLSYRMYPEDASLLPRQYQLGLGFDRSGGDRKSGLPEVAGGGSVFEGPIWPAGSYENGLKWGAPDGYPDAVIGVEYGEIAFAMNEALY